jgi:hypothetical protein
MLNRIFTIFLFLCFILISGCNGVGYSQVDIPTVLNGDWNIKGSCIANDDSRSLDIDQNFEIADGRIFLEGGGECDGNFIGNQLIIKFKPIVFDEEVESCGRVVVTADVSIIITMLSDNEPEYDGIAVGAFKTESECEGESSVELSGDFILKRV